MIIIYTLLCLSFVYSTNNHVVNNSPFTNHLRPTLSFTFGNTVPTSTFNSYSSTAAAFKLSFQKPIKRNVRWNVSWQSLAFVEDVVSYDSWNGLEIRDGERGNLFDLGLRVIIDDGIAGNGMLKPYINPSFGVAFLNQYTEFDYPDTYENPCDDNFFLTLLQLIFVDDPCQGEWNDNMSTNVTDRVSSIFFGLDLGTNLYFRTSGNFALDIGMRYTMIKAIKKNDYSEFESTSDYELIDVLSQRLGADYNTFYLGVTYRFPLLNKRNRDKPRRDRDGKLI